MINQKFFIIYIILIVSNNETNHYTLVSLNGTYHIDHNIVNFKNRRKTKGMRCDKKDTPTRSNLQLFKEDTTDSNIELEFYKNNLETQQRNDRKQFSKILNSINEFVFSIDSKKRISGWNSALEKLSGYSFEELKNKEIDRLDIFENVDEIIDTVTQTYKKEEKITPKYIVLNSKNAEKKTIDISYQTTIYDDLQQLTSVIFVCQNATDRKSPKYLKKGIGYLLMEKEDEAVSLLNSLANMKYNCLFITRNNLVSSQDILHSNSIEIVLLQQNNSATQRNTIIDKLPSIIEEFYLEHENAVVLLCRVDYLLTFNSFDTLLKMIYDINDMTQKTSSLFILNIAAQSVFTEKQICLLQSELKMLQSTTRNELGLDVQLYSLLKYLQGNEKRNRYSSLKDLGKEFKVSRPTLRKKIRFLEKEGFITIVKNGRKKIVFLSKKGQRIIEKMNDV